MRWQQNVGYRYALAALLFIVGVVTLFCNLALQRSDTIAVIGLFMFLGGVGWFSLVQMKECNDDLSKMDESNKRLQQIAEEAIESKKRG